MSNEKGDPSESSSKNGPNQTISVEIDLGGTAAGPLEFSRPVRVQILPVHKTESSIAVSGTSGSLHHREAFQRSSNDASVEAFASANVGLAAVNRGDDFPHPRVVSKGYKVIKSNP
jgi:hypothetical protein